MGFLGAWWDVWGHGGANNGACLCGNVMSVALDFHNYATIILKRRQRSDRCHESGGFGGFVAAEKLNKW